MRPLLILSTVSLTIFSALTSNTLYAQQIGIESRPWTGEVLRTRGQPVIPLFDGWFRNSDGSHSLCFGYFNLNTEQALDIPQGERNNLAGSNVSGTAIKDILPTHFTPVPQSGYRRKFCPFTVNVPADFDINDSVTWTLESAGTKLTAHGHLKPAYALDEPASDGRGDIAPLVKFSPTGSSTRGRNGIHNGTLQAKVGEPLDLAVWIEHPENRVWLGWSKYSGAGSVQFEQEEIMLNGPNMHSSTKALFSEPGSYSLLLQTIDAISSFEFHCCWTNAYVNVNVSN